MTLRWTDKDPQEVLDYDLVWTNRLDTADTIATSDWAITEGDAVLVIDSDSSTSTTAKVWLSAGTVNTFYKLTNTITTVGGRRMEQSVRLFIRAK